MEYAKIIIAPDQATGPVKPVNGVGQPPMIGALNDWPLMHYLKEAGIPYSRLHDVGGGLGGGLYVDIPNLFPDFDADEDDPASYSFAFTDSLMKALADNGVEPFFRLGVTIENWVYYRPPLPALRTPPPKDFAKWARVCEHVIRHYTEGWADGFRMKIDYWEIWNEPEGACMFKAPFEEYLRLYGTTATYLKARFPHLKIGGYGSCGFYAGVEPGGVETPDLPPYMKHWLECVHQFLAAVRDNGWPLDFFSFHSYSEPVEALRQVRFGDRLLNEYGFPRETCERIFDEWLPYVGHDNLGTALQAAGVAAELIGLQKAPCDVACLYDARCGVGNYSPLFNPLTYKPHKAYYAFTAFNELRKRGTAVKVTCEGACPAALYAAAARGADGSIAVMLANDGDQAAPFTVDVGGAARQPTCRITDADRTDAEAPVPAELPPHSFAVLLYA
jgi:hypothetical protein